MKKTLITSAIILTLGTMTSCSNDNHTLKGGDYMSTQAGTTYNYINTYGDGKVSTFKIDVESCNKNKSSCEYITKMKNSDAKDVDYAIKFTNTIKDGAVYYRDDMQTSAEDRLSFPAKIELGKSQQYSYSTKYADITGTQTFTKIIPEIEVNDKTYMSCIEDSDVSIFTPKEENSEVIESSITSISCKGIGLVKSDNTQTTKSIGTIRTVTVLESISQ